MKTISAVLVVLLLVLAPVEVVWVTPDAALKFPYATLGDAAKDTEGVEPGSCQGEYGAVMAVVIPIRYLVLYIGDGKILAGEWLSAESFNQKAPTFLWVGTVDKDGTITMLTREPYDLEKHGTGPCRLLYPERYI